MAENRYVGSYPIIGIRPNIDGRKDVLDVRGSLKKKVFILKMHTHTCMFPNNVKIRAAKHRILLIDCFLDK